MHHERLTMLYVVILAMDVWGNSICETGKAEEGTDLEKN